MISQGFFRLSDDPKKRENHHMCHSWTNANGAGGFWHGSDHKAHDRNRRDRMARANPPARQPRLR
jgi:hypothetical protein